MQNDAMIDIRDLSVTFRRGGKAIKAVNGVSLSVKPGEVVALLGESGSGKSVTMRSLLRLHPKGTLIEGDMSVDGRDVMELSNRALSDLRGAVVSMVFQEPRLALDPVYTVGSPSSSLPQRGDELGRTTARQQSCPKWGSSRS